MLGQRIHKQINATSAVFGSVLKMFDMYFKELSTNDYDNENNDRTEL